LGADGSPLSVWYTTGEGAISPLISPLLLLVLGTLTYSWFVSKRSVTCVADSVEPSGTNHVAAAATVVVPVVVTVVEGVSDDEEDDEPPPEQPHNASRASSVI
jgi:hypothetical protein